MTTSAREPYYRLTTAQSDLDKVLYEQPKVSGLIQSAAMAAAQTRNRAQEPRISLLKGAGFEFLFKRPFRPAVNAATQWLSHDPTGTKFEADYGGEYLGRAYRAIDFNGGEVSFNPVFLTAATFAYCKNFVFQYVERLNFKVSSDVLYEVAGEAMFAWFTMCSPYSMRPALLRSIHETVFEAKWIPGAVYNPLLPLTNTFASFYCHYPYEPIQGYMAVHAPFTVYLPLNFFTLNNITQPYPEAAVYSLPRYYEYTDRALDRCINFYITSIVPLNAGLVRPVFTGATPGPAAWSWVVVPAMTRTRLLVEHIVLHKDLQPMLATTSHAFMFRQFYKDTETLSDKNQREISVTKVIETVYLIARHYYSTTHTEVAGETVQIAVGPPPVTVPVVWEIDPFSLPTGEAPIDDITISARGQVFFGNQRWHEISSVWSYVMGHSGVSSTENHCIAPVSFAMYYFWEDQQSGSYDSGFGPNLKTAWTAHAFDTADPGILDQIVVSYNVGLAFRGAFSVRYT